MLILSRKKNETVLIKGQGVEIRVMIADIGRGKIRLGIDAPKGYLIVREELIKQIQNENELSVVTDMNTIKEMIK